MIAHLAGTVAEKTEQSIIIDVHGVGYEVFVSSFEREAAIFGDPIKLYTHYHVRETAHELFGFSTLTAKRLFELLISVSGVGPKMALAILGLGDIEAIRSAIARSESAFIQKASGVGKRIAERVTVDLHDKVGPVSSAKAPLAADSTPLGRDDALDALLALGLTLQDAESRLSTIDPALPIEARIKKALTAS